MKTSMVPESTRAATLQDLPHELLVKVAESTDFKSKAALTCTSRELRGASEESWGPKDYFEAAGDPCKPETLRIPHRSAVTGEKHYWRSACSEIVDFGGPLDGCRELISPEKSVQDRKYVRALKTLARQPTTSYAWPPNLSKVAEKWPIYAAALEGASRAKEAAPLRHLMDRAASLATAALSGDEATVMQMLEQGTCLPQEHVLLQALAMHPHLADTLIHGVIRQAGAEAGGPKRVSTFLSSLYREASVDARRALLGATSFSSNPDVFKAFEAAAYWDVGTSQAHISDLYAACSPEQLRRAFDVRDGEPSTRLLKSMGWHAESLAAMLPWWIAVGGSPQALLIDMASWPHVWKGSFRVVTEAGRCAQSALNEMASRKYGGDHSLLCIDVLLEVGSRLSWDQLQGWKALHKGEVEHRRFTSEVIPLFAKHDAMPSPGWRRTWLRVKFA